MSAGRFATNSIVDTHVRARFCRKGKGDVAVHNRRGRVQVSAWKRAPKTARVVL